MYEKKALSSTVVARKQIDHIVLKKIEALLLLVNEVTSVSTTN